jgi:hypothetical protein
VDVDLSTVLEHEADRVRDEEPEDDQPQVEPRLPAIGESSVSILGRRRRTLES